MFSESLFLFIPCATLWYYQLVLSLSSDISENPGPSYPLQTSIDPISYFSFCNWILNTLCKEDFSRINLLNAHNSIYEYDIISLCETSLGIDEHVPENSLPGYLYHPCNHPSGEKKVLVFFTRTHYLYNLEAIYPLMSALLRNCILEGRRYFLQFCIEIPFTKLQVQNFIPLLENLQIYTQKF